MYETSGVIEMPKGRLKVVPARAVSAGASGTDVVLIVSRGEGRADICHVAVNRHEFDRTPGHGRGPAYPARAIHVHVEVRGLVIGDLVFHE